MLKKAPKACGNVYYNARNRASINDKKYNSREKTAEAMDINSSTLSRYELDTLRVPAEMVVLMADMYDAPELINYYCTHECVIGKNYKTEVEIKDIALIALQFSVKLEEVNENRKKLIELASDGVVDINEESAMIELVEYFGKIKQTIDELELWLKINNIDKKRAHKNMDPSKNLRSV